MSRQYIWVLRDTDWVRIGQLGRVQGLVVGGHSWLVLAKTSLVVHLNVLSLDKVLFEKLLLLLEGEVGVRKELILQAYQEDEDEESCDTDERNEGPDG